jgi:hypothetical protein
MCPTKEIGKERKNRKRIGFYFLPKGILYLVFSI